MPDPQQEFHPKIILSYYKKVDNRPTNICYLTVVATGNCDMPSDVFCYQRGVNQYDTAGMDRFIGIASAADMYDIPSEETKNLKPVCDLNQQPFYRCNSVEVVARTPTQLNNAIKKIRAEVYSLVQDYYAFQTMGLAERDIIEKDMITTLPYNQNIAVNPALCDDTCVAVIPEGGCEKLFTLVSNPSGTINIIDQEFISVDKSIEGWIPNESQTITAKYEYCFGENLEKETQFFPLDPEMSAKFFLNNVLLNYGEHYTIANNTIYWIGIPDNQFDEYHIQQDTPWAANYVDPEHQGTLNDFKLYTVVAK